MSSEPNHTKVLISQIWHYKSVEKKWKFEFEVSSSVEKISPTQTYPIKFIWFDRSLCTTASFVDITIETPCRRNNKGPLLALFQAFVEYFEVIEFEAFVARSFVKFWAILSFISLVIIKLLTIWKLDYSIFG